MKDETHMIDAGWGTLANIVEEYTNYLNSDAEELSEDGPQPLSVSVRSGWQGVGRALAAEEFELLMATGGPAVRIVGELDEYAQPINGTIRVQAQDWGTPWTDLNMYDRTPDDAEARGELVGLRRAALLWYASEFWYGY